ncbi:hypothetical protein L484_006369 [Morus notabilis]|uniref:DUF7705 domain-containing protein n=1 Tax=Morus notabilis TaxID=981085 RepID=W9S0H0_9ROSA|nr:hypothetical protein L484_006369 [Morus notabilis]
MASYGIQTIFTAFLLDNTIQKKRSTCKGRQIAKESDNVLGAGDEFPILDFEQNTDPDLYAVEKELCFGSLCEEPPPKIHGSFG